MMKGVKPTKGSEEDEGGREKGHCAVSGGRWRAFVASSLKSDGTSYQVDEHERGE